MGRLLRNYPLLIALSGLLAGLSSAAWLQAHAASSRADHTNVAQFEMGDSDGGFQVRSVGDGELALAPTLTGLTSWAELNTVPLPQERFLHAAVALGRHVFVIGGSDGTGTLQATVYHSIQQPDGTLGDWQSEALLPQALREHAAVSIGQTVLVIGGQDQTGSPVSTVYQSSLTEVGGLTAWQTLDATPLPQPLAGHTATFVNGSVLVIGGKNASSIRQQTVYRAGLRADGSLTGWVETAPLPVALSQHKAAAVYDCLFVVGGKSDADDVSAVYAAQVQPDGGIEAWQDLAQARLPKPLNAHVLLATSGRLIVAGGFSSVTEPPHPDHAQDRVYWAGVQPNCTLSAWQELPGAALPHGLVEAAGVALNKYLYLIGGQSGSGPFFDQVYRTELIPAGLFGPWQTLSTTPLPDAVGGPAAVVANGRLYVAGGENQTMPLTQTTSASLQPGGGLDGWRIEAALPGPLVHHALLDLGDRLLLLGGSDGNADSAAVYQAGLGPDGTLASWSAHPCPLPVPVSYHAAVTAGDYVFVSGGRTGFAETAAVYRLRQADDGSQGCWQIVTSLPLPLAGHAMVAAGGYLYISGGITQAGGDVRNNLYKATISPDGSLTSWIELSSSPLPRHLWGHRMLARDGYLYVVGGYESSSVGAQHQVYRAAIQANGDLGAWQELPDNALPQAVYDHAIAYDDLYLFVVGGLRNGQPQANIYSAALYRGVPYAAFTHQFDLGSVQDIGTLDWQARGDPGAVLSVRFRIAGDDATYGGWSEAFTSPPIPIYERGRYVQYQLLVENPGGGVKAIDEVGLTYGDVGDYVRVIDDNRVGVPNAEVYLNGQSVGITGARGVLPPTALPQGLQPEDQLAVLSLAAQANTVRDAHTTPDSRGVGWAHRTYLTNLETDAVGQVLPYTVTQRGGQVIHLQPGNPLILFNLVVSLEWSPDVTYTQQISHALHLASDYLYDLSDGQMALGHVAIYSNGEHWADADIQISAKNSVQPHAYIGGITSNDKSQVIRAGRFWNGDSGNQGAWDEPAGFRTLAHEFGHYALYLYDEYTAYVFDHAGNAVDEIPAYCTGPEIVPPPPIPEPDPQTDPTNASAMCYQYNTSELDARNVPGLWDPLCEQTLQWQMNGESAWETLTRKYADFLSSPRWQFITPMSRGSVVRGPEDLPSALPDWPAIEVHEAEMPVPSRELTVYSPQGPYWGALVALYTNQGGHPVAIDQGFTNQSGRIDIYGARPGDTLRAASFDGALSGSVSVTDATEYTLVLAPPAGLQALAVPGLNPYLSLSPSTDGSTLYLGLSGLGPGGTLVAIATQSGGSASQATALAYSSAQEAYVGSVAFSALDAQPGTGSIQVIGAGVGSQGISLNSTYALQAVPRDRMADLYSADGNLHIYLITDTVPANGYAVLAPLNAPPTSPSLGWQIIGNVYNAKLSGALAESLQRPAMLELHYDGGLLNPFQRELGIYRWEPNSQIWQAVPASLDEERKVMAAPVTTLGIYALLAQEAELNRIFLPFIFKGVR